MIEFNKDSKMFKDCMMLIDRNMLLPEMVPNVSNLRELVADELGIKLD